MDHAFDPPGRHVWGQDRRTCANVVARTYKQGGCHIDLNTLSPIRVTMSYIFAVVASGYARTYCAVLGMSCYLVVESRITPVTYVKVQKCEAGGT